MKRYTDTAREILLRILELSEDTAAVEISLGYTTKEGTCENGIVIKSAPSKVVREIVNDPRVLTCHMESDGLHIEPHRGKER